MSKHDERTFKPKHFTTDGDYFGLLLVAAVVYWLANG